VHNTRAILLMVGAMAALALVDTFVKLAARTLPAGQILMVTSALTAAMFVLWVWKEGERVFTREFVHPVMLWRAGGEVLAAIGFITALSLAPLSTVTAVGQAQPLVVTLGAAIFLKESVGWRRWLAVMLGMLGMLIIIRPGFGDFDPNLLWVLVYIVGLTMRDLVSRRLPAGISNARAVAMSMVPVPVAGFFIMTIWGGWHPIEGITYLWLFNVSAFMALALWLITASLRAGEVSAVIPFRYSRILFALALAYPIFGEVPDALTCLGVVIIVGSGMYAFWRERIHARKAG